MIRKLLAGTAVCSLGFLLVGCTLPQPQNLEEEEMLMTGEVVQNETGISEEVTGEENLLEEALPALAHNMTLSFEVSKGWQGTITQGNTNSNPPYVIPLHVKIKNLSKKQLARVRPKLDDQGEIQQAPSLIVSCMSTDEDHLAYSQNIFSLFPGLVAAGAQRPYTPKVLQNNDRTDVTIGAHGEITVDTVGWTPRLMHYTTMQEGETVEGILHLSCKLFVSKRAGVNDCGCYVDENPTLTDTQCFQSCYPDADTQSPEYTTVDYTNPGSQRVKVDEDSMQIDYVGVATKCDFGCDMEYSFSL